MQVRPYSTRDIMKNYNNKINGWLHVHEYILVKKKKKKKPKIYQLLVN